MMTIHWKYTDLLNIAQIGIFCPMRWDCGYAGNPWASKSRLFNVQASRRIPKETSVPKEVVLPYVAC